ncbi:SPOR domain-containing protein [Pseudorhodoferax sp.]|uniref:SPOR domain-containing protein n=1 Tax=Pseudorhodoferax sp. TaxID=1993553 RepID=UPI002DD6AB79|nr:SPOR domain-containing protein [Pseudorhodoferax sp.]
MAFFKFRARGPKGDEQPASPAETIDDMRRRARHRLIGATVLVLVGVLGFPLLFDTQPRPIQVDIPIEIPDRDKAKIPGAGTGGKIAQAEAEAAPRAAEPGGHVAADASLSAKEEVVAPRPQPAAPPRTEAKAESRPEPKAEAKTEAKSEPKTEPKSEAKAAPPTVDSGARARALLEGKAATPAPAATASAAAAEQAGRFVVQVGAFADAEKAREARTRLERAGLKTYTQEVQTKDGARIRVRVGPYGQRADADKVAERIKALSLPASVLSL